MRVKPYFSLVPYAVLDAFMLLSLYASLRWWDKGHYALKMTIFTLLISLASTFLAANFLSWVYGPASALSFPFYGYSDEVAIPFPLGESGDPWMGYYQIRFLTGQFYQVFPINHQTYQVTFFSTVLSHSYGLLVPFSVFTLVNLGGALIGILVNRVNPEDKWKLKGKALFVGLALGLIFVGIGIWLGFLQVIRTTNGYSWVDHPYFIDAYAFVAFGITWLFIIAGEIYAYFHS